MGSNPAGRTIFPANQSEVTTMIARISAFFAAVLLTLGFAAAPSAAAAAQVRIITSFGPILVELDSVRAPKTVENFLAYVRSGFYDGTIFHRVMRGFMIQGGGFTPDFNQKPTNSQIPNEADNGLSNATGTIAMARTSDPHSATAQFFINTVDNTMLDHRSKTDAGWGYAVFGKVIDGMDTVRRIEALPVYSVGPHENVPRSDAVIQRVEIVTP